jgi:hypothetical protein
VPALSPLTMTSATATPANVSDSSAITIAELLFTFVINPD